MKKVLVVGGTGFIGYNLIKKIKKSFQIFSISKNKPYPEFKVKGIKYIICDITKKNQIKKRLNKNFNFIINLGGYINHADLKKTYLSHFEGCKNLVDFFKNKKVEKFIQIGSSMEYGKAKVPHKETYKCNPIGNYGKSKYLASEYIKKNLNNFNIKYFILRLYQIYGPYQNQERLLPIIINKCLKNEKFACTSGFQKRDFLYVGDLVELLEILIKEKNKSNLILNVGSGKKMKVKYLINSVKKLTKKGLPDFGKIKMRKDESINNYPDISKVQKLFKWKPKTSLKKGINKTILFYKKKLNHLNK